MFTPTGMNPKNKNFLRLLIPLLLIILLMTGCQLLEELGIEEMFFETEETIEEPGAKEEKPAEEIETDDVFKVTYIDVGQGDSQLLERNRKYMLVDAGETSAREKVSSFLKDNGIQTLDYVVATHPHSDHIGGMDVVIRDFDIIKVLMPKVTATTKVYERMIEQIENKNLKITVPKVGEKMYLDDVEITFLAPNSAEYSDMNNYSIVFIATFKDTKFMFTGDAEALSEKEILSNGLNISADVLKTGHHGSHSSTSKNFFAAVNPRIAIICCAEDNSYGHPHNETLETLKNITTYITKDFGDITLTSDGKNIAMTSSKGEAQTISTAPSIDPLDIEYVDESGNGLIKGNINSSGEKIYHIPGGAYYNKTTPEELFSTEREAQEAGFRKSGN